jgi:hypothetical protein
VARVVTEALIPRLRAEVFDYVTTPANWLHWQSAVRSVGGLGADHSSLVGEEITAEYKVGGRVGTVVFKVVEREEPRLWMIEGATRNSRGTISYELWPHQGGTKFTRIFDYQPGGLVLKVMDKPILKRRIERESKEAVRILAEILASIPR